MQGIRALLALLLVAAALQAQRAVLESVDAGLVSGYTFRPGPGCSYTLTLNLTTPPGRVEVLLNGTLNVTGPVRVEEQGPRITIVSPAGPPGGLSPGSYHVVAAGGRPVARISCSARPGPAGSPGDIRVPQPSPAAPQAGETGERYNSRDNILVSALAGAATLVLVVVENGRAGAGDREPPQREAGNDL